MTRLAPILFGTFVLTLLALCILTAVSRAWPDTDCLIYGIDYNGKNEPFGLFCF